jgi:hypothetical protein
VHPLWLQVCQYRLTALMCPRTVCCWSPGRYRKTDSLIILDLPPYKCGTGPTEIYYRYYKRELHYTTNRQVAGSIPDDVIGIFQQHNPAGRTMALGSTWPPTEMNTRCIPGGKGGRCIRLTTLPPSCAIVMKSGNLNFLEPSGPLQACNGTDCFTFW